MSHRSTPLILSLRRTILALDPDHGGELWRHELQGPAARIFILERYLLLVLGSAGRQGRLRCLGLDTGATLGEIELGFRPVSGIAHGNRLYLASNDGAACLTSQGAMLWRALVEPVADMSGDPQLVARNHQGVELWRVTAHLVSGADTAGIALGELLAQPDVRGLTT